jgi:hypothetical protein
MPTVTPTWTKVCSKTPKSRTVVMMGTVLHLRLLDRVPEAWMTWRKRSIR